MDDNELLRQITIPAPCPMDWNLMRGDKRVRHCAACGLRVHNLAAMTSAEAAALVRSQGGELCGRVTRNEDGAIITADTRPEPRVKREFWQFNIRSLMLVIAGLAAYFGFMRMFSGMAVVTAGRMCLPRNAVQTCNNPAGPTAESTDQ